jgi:hypothetical protein
LCNAVESEDTTFNVADVGMENHSEDVQTKDGTDNNFDDIIAVETLVAASTVTAEGSEECILARIKGFDGKYYTVEDAEIEEEPSIEIVQKEYPDKCFLCFLM